MNFQSANAEARDAIDFGARVGNIFWMDGAEGEKAIGRDGTIIRDPVVHGMMKSHQIGRDVIDQAGALDTERIEESEERFGIGGIFFDVGVILAAFFDERERLGLEHVQRLNVNVDVDDRLHARS